MRTPYPAATGVVLVWLLSSCGDANAPASGLRGGTDPGSITSGLPDQANTYPNVGALLVQRPSDGQIVGRCSGTLIAPTVFVTAGHCTLILETQRIPAGYTAYVSFDNAIPFFELTDLATTHLIAVTAIVTNPDLNVHRGWGGPGDIGVVLLPQGSTPGITPAALPPLGLLDELDARNGLRDAKFTVVGYGRQDRVVGGGTPFFQDENPVPRKFAVASFNALDAVYLHESQNQVLGDGGACLGDSGGPNFLDLGGVSVLVGNTIGGDAVCRAQNTAIRLDTPTARAFLGKFVTLP